VFLSVVALAGAGFALAAGLPGIPKVFQPYRSWHRVNAKPIGPTATTAHPGIKNVFASKRRVKGRYPYGTILVKEGYPGGKKFLSLIATMRKIRGVDPKHGDWNYIEYTRSDPSERFTEIARDRVCWGCHVLAKKTDWVFTQR
jgi:cytochrome P460